MLQLFTNPHSGNTPNVQGSEKVVIAKNNRKLLKAKCASCGKMKSSFFAGKLSEPSRAEGSGIFGDVAMAVGDLQLQKECHILQKKMLKLDDITLLKQ